MRNLSKNFLGVALLFFAFGLFSAQEKEVVNPKGKWYFGAEIGKNTISSFELGESNTSFQAGVLAEYYFARHWSLIGRIKYFETGVSFYKPNTHSGSWFDLGTDGSYGSFNGAVITIPVNVKWEFRLHINLGASLKLGYTFAMEVKSEYGDYLNNKPSFQKNYGGLNSGIGLNYFINDKMAVYIDNEFYIGNISKGREDGFFGPHHHFPTNRLINFGFKYQIR